MKILINEHWEDVSDLYDVSRIIREYYNGELANKLDYLIEDYESQESYAEQLSELEDIIDQIRSLVM